MLQNHLIHCLWIIVVHTDRFWEIASECTRCKVVIPRAWIVAAVLVRRVALGGFDSGADVELEYGLGNIGGCPFRIVGLGIWIVFETIDIFIHGFCRDWNTKLARGMDEDLVAAYFSHRGISTFLQGKLTKQCSPFSMSVS